MAVILCNDNFCAAFLSVSVFLLKRCLLLLASHCFMSTKFFLFYPALNDWPFMKYASNYFFFVRRLLACFVLYYPPPLAELVFARALFLSSFFSRLYPTT